MMFVGSHIHRPMVRTRDHIGRRYRLGRSAVRRRSGRSLRPFRTQQRRLACPDRVPYDNNKAGYDPIDNGFVSAGGPASASSSPRSHAIPGCWALRRDVMAPP